MMKFDMKHILLFLISGLLVLAGCSVNGKDLDSENGDAVIESFKLEYNGLTHNGRISDGRISVGGIVYGSMVTGVKVGLPQGATISPAPETFVGQWPRETSFTVTGKSGATKDYLVVLSDYIADSPSSEPDVPGGNVLFFTDFDESDGIPDPNVWTLCPKGKVTWNANMSESYDQAYVKDGNLILKAEKIDGVYKTGGIKSEGKLSFKNARIDISAKFIKTGKGAFPALWLMPQTPVYKGWPDCGEIDIMELLNNDKIVYQTVHNHYKNTLQNNKPQGTVTAPYNQGEYNTYSVEFDEENIKFFINGKETLSYGNLHLQDEASKKQWPYSTDFYLILNFALGGEGTWPGPITDSDLPMSMAVDWVKVTSLEKKESEKVVMAYLVANDFQYDLKFKGLQWENMTHVLPAFCRICPDGSLNTKDMDKHLNEITSTARAHGVKVIGSFFSNAKGEFEAAVQSPQTREVLADNIVRYANEHGLDGIDIDYEDYVGLSKNVPNLLDLFSRIRSKMEKGDLLTSTMAPGVWLDYSKEWHKYFDYINLMIYDRSKDDNIPQQHSSYEHYLEDIENCMTRYAIPAGKVVPGLPFYGFTWESGEKKDIRYSAILEKYPNDPSVKDKDNVGKIYYNGRKTIRKKCEYAKEQGLAGVMIWQVMQDAVKDEDKLMTVVGEIYGRGK